MDYIDSILRFIFLKLFIFYDFDYFFLRVLLICEFLDGDMVQDFEVCVQFQGLVVVLVYEVYLYGVVGCFRFFYFCGGGECQGELVFLNFWFGVIICFVVVVKGENFGLCYFFQECYDIWWICFWGSFGKGSLQFRVREGL